MITSNILIKAKTRDDLIRALEQILDETKRTAEVSKAYNCNVITEDAPFSLIMDTVEARCDHMVGGRCSHEDYPDGFLLDTLCGTDECPLVK